MNDVDIKLRRRQEQASATAARKALDANNAAEALHLIDGAVEFWPQNLIIIMSVIGFHSQKRPLVEKAYRLFGIQLDLCSNVCSLVHLALWVRNPSRAKSIPYQLKEAIDRRRFKLEPDWDGKWVNAGLGPNNLSLALITNRPDDVHNPADCLTAASQTGNWFPWINRYRFLGGDSDDPAYLKLMVAKAVASGRTPKRYFKSMLKKFAHLGRIQEVRKFLIRITPTRSSLKGFDLNPDMAICALRIYSECERLQHTVDDWVHIANSALYLGELSVAKTAARVLIEHSGNPEVDKALARLNLVIGRGENMLR
ncbi:MAG: hypothetical protein KGI45_01075 [Patescibacteria group bacterium]|nr:hypothetical protein [Patescibacteria group bacterium]MDE1941190.1 hypothetical protein [Patescibacteria group bacterium]MDE1966650.1 hypothetical protein [Patescibacteria group bacterium]